MACANYAFFNEIEGKTPPELCEKGGPSKAKTKAELLQYLRDSFDYSNQGSADDHHAKRAGAGERTLRGAEYQAGTGAVAAVWHIADHYGQIVEYLRMNGTVPPRPRQHGLTVR